MYGGQSGTKAEQAYYAAFKEKYKGIAQAQQRWIEEVVNTGKLKTASGLEFFWPDTTVSSSGYVNNTTSICNYPVQMFATADIIPIALRFLWDRMYERGMESFIVNTVHDSIIAEIKPDEEELFRELSVQSLTYDVYNYIQDVYNITFNVPLGVGYKADTHWGVGDELKFNVENPNI